MGIGMGLCLVFGESVLLSCATSVTVKTGIAAVDGLVEEVGGREGVGGAGLNVTDVLASDDGTAAPALELKSTKKRGNVSDVISRKTIEKHVEPRVRTVSVPVGPRTATGALMSWQWRWSACKRENEDRRPIQAGLQSVLEPL